MDHRPRTPEVLAQLYRPLCVVRAPIATRSGYGGMSRDIVRHLIEYDKYNVEIHVRSIFLQGIYFMKDNLPKHLMAFQVPNQKMLNFAEEINMPYAAFLLSFPFLNQFIDCVVIGFDSVSQFEEILSNVSGVSLEALDFIYELENEWLLNPSNWK